MADVNCSKCGLPMVFGQVNWYHINADGNRSLWPGKCGAGAGAINAIPTTVNSDPEPDSLEDLRNEAEAHYQALCQKAQLGGPATLDELADVTGIMVKVLDAILEER